MHIEYELSESDFVAATQFASHRRTTWRRIRLWLVRLTGLVFAIMAVLLLSQRGNKIINLMILIYGIYLCCWSLMTTLQSRRRFRRMTQLHGRYILEPDENCFRYIAPAGESKMEWRAWGSFAEDESSFVLGQRGSTYFMPIPKRELTPIQITELRSLFETHIPHN
jgi:YcxB-like protein